MRQGNILLDNSTFVLSPRKWCESTVIKENLIPKELTSTQVQFVYASEADILMENK